MSKKTIIILSAVASTVLIAIIWMYTKIYAPNTAFEEKTVLLFIHEPTEISAWIRGESGRKIVKNEATFLFTAAMKKYKTLKPGRYRIKKGMNNNAIINMLRSGSQEPVTVRTDDVETIYELAGKLGKHLQQDSLSFIRAFSDPATLDSMGFNEYTLPASFMPNTYEFFWTMTPRDYMTRMKKIYDQYWTDDRRNQAQKIGLNPVEVATLASIVKAETGRKDEAPKIAGLYLNRLRTGIALQSDPTAVFGKKNHASRVYLSDLQNDSPYNTYLRRGLPPGPINFPEILYLDAVLAPEQHDYIYMCAQAEATGYHNFARTLDQHNVYRRQYTDWLEKKGIR
jgi:UPF0755 protein